MLLYNHALKKKPEGKNKYLDLNENENTIPKFVRFS